MDKPICPQKSPYVLKGEKKKYAWCSCGKSAKQPFCDGSHKGTDFSPIIVDNLKESNIAWCGCKCSANTPYCDGAHSKL
jgi:CDGSH-type Zn-finger protein